MSLHALLAPDSARVEGLYSSLRSLLCPLGKNVQNRVGQGQEDTEMVDEVANKNGSQKFADEIARNLSEIMAKFISAYKQILEKKEGKHFFNLHEPILI